MDRAKAEKAVRELLGALGENPDRPGLEETARRVTDFYQEFFWGLSRDPKAELESGIFQSSKESPTTEGGMVATKGINFHSLCEHDLLPFFGKVGIVYIPDGGRIAGFSQLVRTVEVLSHRPQLQERLTSQVADTIQEVLRPKGVLVLMEAEQLCLSMRGLKKPGIVTITSAFTGILKEETTRAEALTLLKGR
ncbi:MAG: GTP cyclohydrolase [candidate division Zixibacteria bacterium DG_27]|nr:MAG: GTP cyclohydrolase [candidate division Zixibacteria bacterium DG_27]